MSDTANEDALTLTLIASGLLQIEEALELGKTFCSPYPPSIEEGLNRLSLCAIQSSRADAPQSVPDLLSWCRQPLGTWPLDPALEIDREEPLLAFGESTDQCRQLALDAINVTEEYLQNRFYNRLIKSCTDRGDQEGYVALRRFIIENPVLTRAELIRRTVQNAALQGVRDLLMDAYIPAPLTAACDGNFQLCSRCGYILRPSANGEWTCASQACREACPKARAGKSIPLEEEIRVLRREIQRYMAQPGKSELRLCALLTTDGATVELWPGFDAYDLRVTFPDHQVWAIDVKDWKRPFALVHAIRRQPIPETPPAHRRIFVVPEERVKRDRTYIQTCRNLAPQAQVLRERELLRQARAKLQEGDRA